MSRGIEVDASGTADLVVDSAGEAWSHRFSRSCAQQAGAVDRGWLARCAGNVVVELLRRLHTDALGQSRPQ
jgi:hypothetical protein